MQTHPLCQEYFAFLRTLLDITRSTRRKLEKIGLQTENLCSPTVVFALLAYSFICSLDRTLSLSVVGAPTPLYVEATSTTTCSVGFSQGREASKQSHVSSMIHGSVLARTSLEDAVSCDVANKMATTFLSPTEVSEVESTARELAAIDVTLSRVSLGVDDRLQSLMWCFLDLAEPTTHPLHAMPAVHQRVRRVRRSRALSNCTQPPNTS